MQPLVKQPIHDDKNQIFAYEIMYSNNESWSEKTSDEDAASTMEALLLLCNSDDFLDKKPAFVTLTQNLLLRNVPSIFATDALILQLDQDFLLSPSAMDMLEKYHKQGYKVAMVGFEFNSLYLSAMNLIDYIKLSFLHKDSAEGHESAVRVAEKLGKTVIAYNVNTEEGYHIAKEMGIQYMQGIYIGSSLPSLVRNIEHLPGNFFELMIAILREEPDIDEVEQIVSRDVTLTYSLLRLVNSAFFSLRTKVQSVHQALVILGLTQLKQWIYLLSFKHDGNVPKEFIRLSLMRARFCEALHGYVRDINISGAEAYLMGMFSTLDALLQRPLSEVLGELSISDDVKAALLTREGKSGMLYQLVLSYEQADWHRISAYAEDLGLPANVISQKYFECMDNVNDLWKKLATEI